MVLEAGYSFTSDNFRHIVKLTILIRKRPGMEDAAFVQHYNNIHAQMAAPLALKHNIISYTLSYCLAHDRRIMDDVMRGGAKSKFLPYDAICTFCFPDWKALAKFMYDRDIAALAKDHPNFMVEEDMRYLVGDEYVLIDEGQRVN